MKIIITILNQIHNLIHFLKLPHTYCFAILRIIIRLENKDSICWKCKHFDGFYFDQITYDCKKFGTQMWGEVKSCQCYKGYQNEK